MFEFNLWVYVYGSVFLCLIGIDVFLGRFMMNMVMGLGSVFDRYPCVYGFVFLGLRHWYSCKFYIRYVQLALDLS